MINPQVSTRLLSCTKHTTYLCCLKILILRPRNLSFMLLSTCDVWRRWEVQWDVPMSDFHTHTSSFMSVKHNELWSKHSTCSFHCLFFSKWTSIFLNLNCSGINCWLTLIPESWFFFLNWNSEKNPSEFWGKSQNVYNNFQTWPHLLPLVWW